MAGQPARGVRRGPVVLLEQAVVEEEARAVAAARRGLGRGAAWGRTRRLRARQSRGRG